MKWYENAVDITRQFDGKRIFIRHHDQAKWVSARIDRPYSPVLCSADAPLDWERFSVWVAPDGWCALKSFNGKYISVRQDLYKKFIRMHCSPGICFQKPECNECVAPCAYAMADVPQAWEMLRIYKVDELYALMTKYNNNWLSCWSEYGGGENELAAFYRTVLEPQEAFMFDIVVDG